ncbi:MAG: hypothetical protein P8M78_12200 [Myxococcota bacterium]|nr:hypothetical protein [Myxococcota bacterium]
MSLADVNHQTSHGVRTLYYIALAGMAGAVSVLCLRIAHVEYFGFDDWWLLHEVRQPGFSWIDTFFPFGGRRYWAFRPVGEQTFYRLAYQAFGLEAGGYFALSLAVNGLSSWVTYRIARSLGMLRPIAFATGILTITAIPTLSTLWDACLFTHILSQFCMASALWLFIEGVRRNSEFWVRSSVIPFVVGLLSHESTLVIPAVMVAFSLVIDDSGSRSEKVRKALFRILPHALFAGVYLMMRIALFASQDVANSSYAPNFDPVNIASAMYFQILLLTGSSTRLFSLLLIVSLTCFWVGTNQTGRRALVDRCIPTWSACSLWFVLVLIPMLSFAPFSIRFSIFIEIPVSLATGVLMDVALRRAYDRHHGYALVAVALFVGLTVPWVSLIERSEDESLNFPRQIREAITDYQDQIPEYGRLILLYGANGLATEVEMDRFRRVSYGYDLMFWNFVPDKHLTVRTHNVRDSLTEAILCENCIYMAIDHDLNGSFPPVQILGPLLLDQGLQSDHADIWPEVFVKRFDLGDTEVADRAKSFCQRRSASKVEIALCRRKIASRLRSRGTSEARKLSRQIRQIDPRRNHPSRGRAPR